MRLNNSGETLLALAGVWFIASVIPDFIVSIFNISMLNNNKEQDAFYLLTYAYLLTKLVVGLSIIFARKLIGKLLGFSSQLDCTASELLSAGIFLLGLYFAFNGVVSISQHYLVFAALSEPETFYFWQGIASLSCGLTLCVFSFSLTKLWRFFKFAGT
uniref:hypothetical protein n=1 Tax=Ningiella ruwaisensis TaxID=2364274 RepID=UPI00109EF5E9|nr:hypothetical protein [Ningiella ruwaisensis]